MPVTTWRNRGRGRKTFRSRKYHGRKVGVKRYPRTVVRNKNNVSFGLGFPKKVQFTHKYSENVALTAALGVFTPFAFACNGLYDPNLSGTGHQPYYFDQMAALYNHYTVIGSKIHITVVPKADTEQVFQVALYINDDASTSLTDINGIAEQSLGRIQTIPADSDKVTHLTAKWSAKKTFGGSILGNDNLQGNSGANPSELSTYIFAIQGITGLDLIEAYVNVQVEYIAVWEELKDIAQS